MRTKSPFGLTVMVYVILLMVMTFGTWTAVFVLGNMRAPRHLDTIECLVHRADPVVHKFCVDQGYKS